MISSNLDVCLFDGELFMKFIEKMIECERKHFGGGSGRVIFDEINTPDEIANICNTFRASAMISAYDTSENYNKNSIDYLNCYCHSFMLIGKSQEFREQIINEIPDVNNFELIKLDLANIHYEEIFKQEGDDFVYLPTEKSILPKGKKGFILYLENFLLADTETKFCLSEISKHCCFPDKFNTRLHPKCAFIVGSNNEEVRKCTNDHLNFYSLHTISARFGARIYLTDKLNVE
jgi:hypothetical protein